MAYLTGKRRYEYEVDVAAIATDLAKGMPGAVASVQREDRATLCVDGFSFEMTADDMDGLVSAKFSPAGVDFRVYAPSGPVKEDDTEFTLDPRRGLDGMATDIRAVLVKSRPLIDAMKAFADGRRRVATGPGEWMGLIRIGGRAIEVKPGGGWDWHLAEEGKKFMTYYADHSPGHTGETMFFQLVQWFLGRGDNPHFPRPLTPDQIALGECLCQRKPRDAVERYEADRAMAEGRVEEWIVALPLPPLMALPPMCEKVA